MEGWVNPGQVEMGVGIEPNTPHMKVHCSTNWAILAYKKTGGVVKKASL